MALVKIGESALSLPYEQGLNPATRKRARCPCLPLDPILFGAVGQSLLRCGHPPKDLAFKTQVVKGRWVKLAEVGR